MNRLLQNKKSAIVVLIIVLLVGLFYIGKFAFSMIKQNEPEIEIPIQQEISSDSSEEADGFETADELDEFLDRTSWEGTGKDGNKSGILFLGDTGAEYKMIEMWTTKGGSPSAFRVSYSVIDGKTILYDAKNSTAMTELECLVSSDRKSLELDGVTYHKVDMLDWIE